MKKFLVIIILIILVVAGYFAWKTFIYKTPEEKAAEALQKSLESAAAGVLPEMKTELSNPLEKMPETNPVSKTNPFKNIKINPFE
jgi:predicted negative regulator of RcsB-dependent stress response